MGRAPNQGGPQRVSMHVVPKAKFAEDEKTTVESQWEDEASTTVEQGEVADKIRDIAQSRRPQQITGGTNTGGSVVEEPTIDDQRHNPVIAIQLARLVITAGNDAGQEIEIRPETSYTVGRAVDNDIVLSDISVSRKHFDLRHEHGSWVIVDRGSGNGTVINGNIEDNPFMLANGDMIEIGNTAFRFDHGDSPPRRASSFDVDVDDEELSTVAGKGRSSAPEMLATPLQQPQPLVRERPKTLPPPVPLRPSPQMYQAVVPQQTPATTLPIPPANRLPAAVPQAPPLLADPSPLPLVPPLAPMQLTPGMLPTTLPGQGRAGPIYGYPQLGDIPPQQLHAQMHLIAAQQNRGDPSNAHMLSSPYGYPAPHMARISMRYNQQAVSRNMKLVFAAGAAVFVAIMVVALSRYSARKPQAGNAAPTKVTMPQTAKVEAKPAPVPPPAPPTAPKPPQRPQAQTGLFWTPPNLAKPEAPKPTMLSTIAKQEPAKLDPPAPPPPPPTAPPTTGAAKDPPKQAPAAPPPPPAVAAKDPPKQDPPKPDPPKQDPPKSETPKSKSSRSKHAQSSAQARPRVAAGDSSAVEAARKKAEDAYRAGKYSEAASYLNAAEKSASDDAEAHDLHNKAMFYGKVGKALAAGLSPDAAPTDAFEALRSALDYDRAAGPAHEGEISKKIAEVAPKAAVKFTAAKNFKKARVAIQTAEQFGSTSSTLKIAKLTLDNQAIQLYNEAVKELDSNPEEAKDKLHTVLDMVDAKSPLVTKAHQKLGN